MDVQTFKLFLPITKVDEEKRLVYGRATEEKPDSSQEIFDYASSKPFYEKWSNFFKEATDGKSEGNLREMHTNKAVGTLPQVILLDDAKAVEVVAKVVDDDAWAKVLEGVYTGFSQGGKYIKRWQDGQYMRYTAEPTEISIVDYPALKSATFAVMKADGTLENKAFKTYKEGSPMDEKEKLEQLKKAIDAEVQKQLAQQLHDELEKIGAKHSKETVAKFQQLHDQTVAMGAKCVTVKAAEDADLQKLHDAIHAQFAEPLQKIFAALDLADDMKNAANALMKITDLKAQIEDLKKKAAPGKGQPKDVQKTADNADDQNKNKQEPPKDPMAAMKMVHSQPIVGPAFAAGFRKHE